MQFKMGHCSFGQNCQYAHVNGDPINLARYGDEEYCRIIPKVKPCWRFLRGGGCPYGQKCHFQHEEPDASFRKTRDLGFCGSRYERSDSRKMKLCYRWEKMGGCPYGMTCYYAHGQEELRRFCSQSGMHQKVMSSSRIGSPTAAPCGSCHDTDREPAREQDKKCVLKWKGRKKVNGIYADWIDELPLVHSSLGDS